MLTREKLQEKSLQSFAALLKEPKFHANKYLICSTSGTSGKGPLVMPVPIMPGDEGPFGGAEHPALFLASASARLRNLLLFFNGRRNLGSDLLLIDPNDLDSDAADIFTNFQPDSIAGIASFIIRAVESAPSAGSVFEKVTTLRPSGEVVTKFMENILRRAFPHATIKMLYAASEFGGISAPSCPYLALDQYHPRDDVEIFIVNLDVDGAGDLAVRRKNSTLEAYLIGDVARFVDTPCPCGNPRTFQLLGRKGFDYIKLAGAFLHKGEFDRVCGEGKEYIADYYAQASSIFVADKLKGKVELFIKPTPLLRGMPSPEEFIADEVQRLLFVTPTKTFAEVVNAEQFLPLEVRVVDSLPVRRSKEVKLLYVEA